MKKIVALLTVMFCIGLLLTACRGSSDSANSSEDPMIQTERETEGGSLETGDGFGFTYFALTIKVAEENQVHLRYEVKEQVEATYVDHAKKIDVIGTEAMNHSGVFFQNVRIQEGVPAEKIMDDILTFYRIEDFSMFDLDVRFDNGAELRIQEP